VRIVLLSYATAEHTHKWIRGLAARGHEIYLFSQGGELTENYPAETSIFSGRSQAAYLKNCHRVARRIKRIRPDIVHAHYATGYGLWGTYQNSAPLVVSVWGTDIADARRGKLLAKILCRRALRKAMAVTATSVFLLNETKAFAQEVGEKIHHVPFGVVTEHSVSPKEHHSGPVTVVFAKVYLDNYAPDLVLRSFAKARETVTGMRLVMIGGGPKHNQLQNLAEKLAITDAVEINGWVPPHRAKQKIRDADIMVMPSFRESFGVAALEASYYGLPVIATEVGGVPEIVRHEETGVLIQPGDGEALIRELIRLAEDRELRQKLGNEGHRFVSRSYSFADSVEKMEDIYRKVAQER
jgi:glycosyltransferase involved in cell wall biosynthesis